MTKYAITLIFCLLPVAAALAFTNPGDRLANTADESRARAIMKNLRCVVCQSESVDDSDAGVARDIRQLVRDRIQTGRSDSEIYDEIHHYYGDFVLLKPPLQINTALLWSAPFVIFVLGSFSVVRYLRALPKD